MKIIIALIIFSILILIHEFGHFLLAKKNGICVTEFSLGMGPKLFSFVKGETRYSLKILPFGGSCMMLGEDEDGIESERAFNNKPVWARISVIVAGPIFNFLLALILSMVVTGFVGFDPPRVYSVDTDSSAYELGLREGDIITEYNGNTINFGRELLLEEYINPVNNEIRKLTYIRDEKSYTIDLKAKLIEKYAIGIRYYATEDSAEVTDVIEDGVMSAAGVEIGDVIEEINGISIKTGQELSEFMANTDMMKTLNIKMSRDNSTYDISVTPTMTSYYSLGFGYNLAREKTTALGVIKYSFVELGYQIETVFRSLGMLFSGKISTDDISGPVGIVDIIGDTYTQSKESGALMTILTMASLTIMLSANLGVMNLLPLPALDGGRLVFLILEAIRKKPIAKEKEGIVHFIGMILLMLLMVFIIFNDIRKL